MLKGALLENRKSAVSEKNNYYFSNPITEIIAHTPEQLTECFAVMEQWRQANHYLVGYVAYEAGLYLQPKLTFIPKKTQLPLLHFIVYRNSECLNNNAIEMLLMQQQPDALEHFIYNARLNSDYENYAAKLEKIHHYLKNGDSYQVNFTGKYHFNFQGQPLQFYKLLRQQQRVEYSAYIDFGAYQILSISPELFFKKTATEFLSKPMKGTAAKLAKAENDLQQQKWLQQNEKNRAENLMIVDLMRNDINQIAQQVTVNKLFTIESFETLHQMVSIIQAKVPASLSFQKIIKTLLPCGSITGAPKIRTLEIINELETEARGIYTGAIGYIMPNNDMCFNVAIRTLVLQDRQGELGVGSGIVVDSEPSVEWQELQTKLKFITAVDPHFCLIESFLYSNGNYRYLDLHLQRLKNSAKFFNFQFSVTEILQNLSTYQHQLNAINDYKIRLELCKSGSIEISHQIIQPPLSNKIFLADEHVNSSNILLQHKTTAASVRRFYDACFNKYNKNHEYFDVLFRNEHNEITEGSRSNIFIEKNGRWYTPPLSAGLLPGIMRHRLIQQKQAIEQAITLQTLQQADKIWLCNSVRGLVQVQLANGLSNT